MSRLEHIPIELIDESPGNPRKSFDETNLQELADNIKQYGILQNVLVIPVGDRYELVYGHRRLRAARLAELKEMPAVIREDLSPEDALELQITENLQRKDVHPMEEAVAFKRLKDERQYKTDEIAARMGKTIEFVTQRIHLNQLIDDIQAAFYANVINLKEAILLCRLTRIDQEQFWGQSHLCKWNKPDFRRWNENVAGAINKYQLDLTNPPFDPEDSQLVEAAGVCSVCPKNTACSTALFPDMKDKARCTDRHCYDLKIERHLAAKINELTNAGTEFYMIARPSDDDTNILKYRKEGYKVLDKWNDYTISTPQNEAITKLKRGLWISGTDAGHLAWIKLGETKQAKAADEGDSIEEQRRKIQERERRAKELDNEKIYTKVYDLAKASDSDFLKLDKDLNKVEMTAVAIAIIDSFGWNTSDPIINQLLGTKDSSWNSPSKQYDHVFQHITPALLNRLMRVFIIRQLSYSQGQNHEKGRNPKAVYECIHQTNTKEVEAIVAEQMAIREKRVARVEKRLEALKSDPPAKKKAAPKKTVKKAKSKVNA